MAFLNMETGEITFTDGFRLSAGLAVGELATALDGSVEAFAEHIPGTTKLIIAQRITSVQEADMIVVLDNGQIVAQGNHEELLATCEIYQDVYRSQKKGGDE